MSAPASLRVAIMGSGSWGTAFAQIVADNKSSHQVTIWGRNAETINEINSLHTNSKFHPGAMLPEKIIATVDPQVALRDADVVVLAVPAQTLRENLKAWGSAVPRGAIVVSLLKGFERGTHARMSEVIKAELDLEESQIAVVTGPNLAGEIIKREPAAVVIACAKEEVAVELQDAFAVPYFRPYTSVDVIGCEVAGTIKNVMALAVGMASGLGMGDNTKATVITRGLAETTRLGVALGADPMTFAGLAGMGDLVATCSSPLSRNRSFGERLGRGLGLSQAQSETKTTAEGVSSAAAVLDLAREYGIDMPIVEAVVDVVANGMPPKEVVRRLMSRTTRSEH
jgi:glycerol-3-phosphate dehydrogenase (NAD(P)+)